MTRTIFGLICIYSILFGGEANDNETTTTLQPDTASAEDKKLDWDAWCKYQPNSYDCTGRGSYVARFYYDIKMDDCKAARFGSCRFNRNKFASMSACQDHCQDVGSHRITANLSEKVYCRFQHDFGSCNEYYPMWYFDMSIRACKGFSYSGCGGNYNRFPTAQICTAVCGTAINY